MIEDCPLYCLPRTLLQQRLVDPLARVNTSLDIFSHGHTIVSTPVNQRSIHVLVTLHITLPVLDPIRQRLAILLLLFLFLLFAKTVLTVFELYSCIITQDCYG